MRLEASARQALAAMVEGDTLRTMLAALRRLFKMTPINTAALRRRLADEAVARGGISSEGSSRYGRAGKAAGVDGGDHGVCTDRQAAV